MLAGWIASGRMRKSPAVIHSLSIASRSCCEASTRPSPRAPAGPGSGAVSAVALGVSLIERMMLQVRRPARRRTGSSR